MTALFGKSIVQFREVLFSSTVSRSYQSINVLFKYFKRNLLQKCPCKATAKRIACKWHAQWGPLVDICLHQPFPLLGFLAVVQVIRPSCGKLIASLSIFRPLFWLSAWSKLTFVLQFVLYYPLPQFASIISPYFFLDFLSWGQVKTFQFGFTLFLIVLQLLELDSKVPSP